MKKEEEAMKEQLSAMLDGELDAGEINRVLYEWHGLGLEQTADVYFLIGEVLRGRQAFQPPSRDIAAFVREALQSERYVSVELGGNEPARKKKHLTLNM